MGYPWLPPLPGRAGNLLGAAFCPPHGWQWKETLQREAGFRQELIQAACLPAATSAGALCAEELPRAG